jgi:BTB/POZ domain
LTNHAQCKQELVIHNLNGAACCCVARVYDLQKQEGLWEDGPPLELNIGGYNMDVKRATIMHAPDSMLARLFSGRWDHVLPRDKSGRIFLDLDQKWVKPILQHLYHLSIADADSEPLVTPEKQFDGDDLIGYYATLDLLGLTKTFYPTGVVRLKPTAEQMPLGSIDPHEFVSKLALTTSTASCDWNAPWKVLYNSSVDTFNFEMYKNRCRNASNTVVFIKEKSTGNVFGGYTGVARTFFFNSGVWRSAVQDPNMFIFALTSCDGATTYKKFNELKRPQYASHDSQLYPFYFASDLHCENLAYNGCATAIIMIQLYEPGLMASSWSQRYR